MNSKIACPVALMLVLASLALPAIGLAHQSPTLAPGLTLEVGFDHLEGVLAWGDSGLVLFAGARVERLAIDTRLYAGTRQALFSGGLYALHLEGAAGPRMALRDEVGFGAWSILRARGVWTWSSWALHSGVFADIAGEFGEYGGFRVRPGGDVGVGRVFEPVRIWLNMSGGYTMGGAGAGGLHLGGALGVQW